MPRIRRNAERDTMKDFLAEVNAQSVRFGYRTQEALGSALGVCQATAGNYLKKPETIRLNALRAMVKVLKLNPVVVLRALGYTTKDIQKITKEDTQ